MFVTLPLYLSVNYFYVAFDSNMPLIRTLSIHLTFIKTVSKEEIRFLVSIIFIIYYSVVTKESKKEFD